MLDSEFFAEEIFGFHVQQAAEKALKAWLEFLGETFPYTHDLGVLLQKLENRGCEVTEFWDLLDFSLFAVQLRYDSLDGPDEPIDRQGSIEKIWALYLTVDAALKK
jgi:HEPN domain-containing protein